MSTQQPSLPKLLFVDDETGVLNAIQRIFHEEPYDILTATGGQAALELLQENGPVQVIISDFRMPGMTGVELLQKVMQRWPDTRRVILSAYPDSDVLLSAVNEGRVHRFLVKPWDNEFLKAAVREMLGEYEMLENFRRNAEDVIHTNRLLSRTNEHLSAILNDVLGTMRSTTEQDHASASNLRPVLSAQPKPHDLLSPRELQIMSAIASGHSLKAIAMDLGLSIKTVSTYKKRLSLKMDFKNDADLIGYTLKNKLLPGSSL